MRAVLILNLVKLNEESMNATFAQVIVKEKLPNELSLKSNLQEKQ